MRAIMMGNAIGGVSRVDDTPDSHVGKRERQKLVHRQAILEAGERVLGADLRECIGVEKIAAQAGLAKGTVYNYFDDKAALVEAVTQSVETRIVDRIQQATRNLPTARARLAAAICAMLEAAIHCPEQAVILERRIGAARGYESLIGDVLLTELKRGEFDRIVSEGAQRAALTLLLGAICAGMRELACERGPWGVDETQSLIAHCLAALGVSEEQAALEAHVALSRLNWARDCM